MKPPAFEYLRPNSLIEAAGMLEEAGEGAQILAGGQSLLPTLSLFHPWKLCRVSSNSRSFIRIA